MTYRRSVAFSLYPEEPEVHTFLDGTSLNFRVNNNVAPLVVEKILKGLFIPGEVGKVVAWNGHEFEIVEARVSGTVAPPSRSVQISFSLKQEHAVEAMMQMYYPIDPRTNEQDWAGATRVYVNEQEDKAWLPAHTDEGTHHDYELQLLAAIDGVFQPYFRQLQVDAFATSETAVATAQRGFRLLAEFYGAVVVQARTQAAGVFLGKRVQLAHPKEGWIDKDITDAITAVETAWTGTKDSELTELAGAIRYVKNSLKMGDVETRWDQEARLAAEAEAAAEDDSEDDDTNNGS